MKRLELFKPLMKLRNNEIIIFDEFRNKYNESLLTAGNIRPFVIFYNENENTYYYLKCRSAYYKSEPKKIRRKFKGEVFIEAQHNNGLLKYDSYVDCSQIFKIDADLLESLVDTECELYKQTSVLREYEILLILDEINNCCNEEPPYLSLLELYKIGAEIKADSLYLCDEKFNKYKTNYEYYEKNIENLIPIDWNYYVSDIESNYNRYNNAISFKKMFQNKYFSYKSNLDEKGNNDNNSDNQDDEQEDGNNQSSGMKM